jgi:Ca2+-binding EF-hand superfamily protein
MTLFSDLNRAFVVLEQRFRAIDQDGGGTLSFEELHAELLKDKFEYGDVLAEMFRSVDISNRGALDFRGFMVLLWSFFDKSGFVNAIFPDPYDAQAVTGVLGFMRNVMLKFDADRDFVLSVTEVFAFFNQHWSEVLQAMVLQRVLEEMYGQNPTASVSLPDFMYILYAVTASSKEATLKGTYLIGRGVAAGFAPAHIRPEQSHLWIQLENAFIVLEVDFQLFDLDKDGLVHVENIYNVIPTASVPERYRFIARMQAKLAQGRIGNQLDFFEYMLLGMLMTQDGSYSDLQPNSTNAGVVKKCFMNLSHNCRQFDADKNNMLTFDEVQNLFRQCFGHVSATLRAAFDRFKFQPMQAEGREALDVLRFFKVLYVMIRPEGCYNPAIFNPVKTA